LWIPNIHTYPCSLPSVLFLQPYPHSLIKPAISSTKDLGAVSMMEVVPPSLSLFGSPALSPRRYLAILSSGLALRGLCLGTSAEISYSADNGYIVPLSGEIFSRSTRSPRTRFCFHLVSFSFCRSHPPLSRGLSGIA